MADIGALDAEFGLAGCVAIEQHLQRHDRCAGNCPAFHDEMARCRQRDLVAMMVKALIHHGAPAAAELWHLDERPLLAQDAGPRQGPNRDRLVPGAESADVADQLEAGKTGVRIIGADVLDILAHAAEFGLADAFARDKDLDRFDLHETDDPALDAQESVGSDDRLVNKQLHRRPVENGGFGRLSVPRTDSRAFDLPRRDVDAPGPPADLAILGAHGQQRLDGAARRARQVETQHKAGMAGMIAAGIEPATRPTKVRISAPFRLGRGDTLHHDPAPVLHQDQTPESITVKKVHSLSHHKSSTQPLLAANLSQSWPLIIS